MSFVTPRLWVGHFPGKHIFCDDPETASELIHEGNVVVVSTYAIAYETLVRVADSEWADSQLRFATTGRV